ncbi:MFS transporter [Bradyrhizobium sp. Arg68]|uniref:MFS transporter n=1 Tax=Bradyrhizobium ivorense TaxID=2511166 RepID=UPI001E3235F7|nr:MFS transporter [Bradyrhizobium ivorense]MCC8943091.1 MFS transporter [Bradyrhizobium ivorense]
MTLSTPADAQRAATVDKQNITRLIVATSVGNALEWYDISVYAYFAVYLSKAFFPANDPTTSLLLTFGTFGLSFMIRPLGGVLLGAYADRHGRKASLMLSIVLMTFGTLALAVMPTYQSIGIVAPIAVILARLVQGFSAGGEFGSSTAFLVEHMPERRGFVASWQFASQGVSGLLGAGFGALLTTVMSPDDLQSWGWRLPFLFGVLIGPVGIYIRNHVDDATPPPATKQESPVVELFTRQKLATILAIGALAVSTAVNYLIVYMPTYVVQKLHMAPSVGFVASLVAQTAVAILAPIAGLVSDRIGRTTHMIIFALLLLVSIFPAFLLLTGNPTPMIVLLGVLWLGMLKSLYYGPLAALMSELFPPATRATGLGLSYNIGVTVFGGMGPAIMTWMGLFAPIGDLAPGYYLTAVCILSLCTLFTIRRMRLA